MALTKKLLHILDNEDEPLPKRLKIAESAINCRELHIANKEAVVLKWIISNSLENNVWDLLDKWLASAEFKELSQNDIHSNDLQYIFKVFLEKLLLLNTNSNINKKLINNFIVILQHRVFQQYLKYNLDVFSKCVSALLHKIDCPVYFTLVLKDLFPKNIIAEEKFYKYFIADILPTLVNSLVVFGKIDEVSKEVVHVVQKCIFNNKTKLFEDYIQQFFEETSDNKKHSLPKDVYKYLISSYDSNTEQCAVSYSVLFRAFCSSCSDFSLIYRFCITIVQILGFDIKDEFNMQRTTRLKSKDILVSKSLPVLLNLFNCLSISTNKSFDVKIADVHFTDFIRNIIKSIMLLNVPSSDIFKIIQAAIAIDPLVIEPIINQIIIFIMSMNNEALHEEYEKLFSSILELFAKLRRIENFVGKMIPALQKSLLADVIFEESYTFLGQIDIISTKSQGICVGIMFPQNILQQFTKCVNDLASWQVINLLKTFIYHLGVAINDFSNGKADMTQSTLSFLEILSILLCQLLKSVRMAEHTVATSVVDKFVKGLDELKTILGKLGTVLLNREHNCVLMRVFLKTSYYWAETFIVLSYYSDNGDISFTRVLDNNYSSCNLTYLHSYLTTQQWILISERITNFGEQPCKKLLHQLYLQKLRAILIFEKTNNDDIINNVVKSLQNNLENNWFEILSEKFTVQHLLEKMDSASLIFLTRKLLKSRELWEMQHVRNSSLLTNCVNYIVLSKIDRLAKQNAKIIESPAKRPLCSRVFSVYSQELFLHCDNLDLTEILSHVKQEFQSLPQEAELQLNEQKLEQLLEILNKFPVIFGSNDIQVLVLLYVFALHNDILTYPGLKSRCESIIIGVMQNCKYNLLHIFASHSVFLHVMNNFTRYSDVFTLLVENSLKNGEAVDTFQLCVSCLTENLSNDKCLECALIVVNLINKLKKTKVPADVKLKLNSCSIQIFNKIVDTVDRSEPDRRLVEAYASALKFYLSADGEHLQKLLSKLNSYIELLLINSSKECTKGYLLMFRVVLNNKQKLQVVDNDVILRVWNGCKKLEIGTFYFEEYSQLVNLIFTLIPNEEFSKVLTDLLSFTDNSIKQEDFVSLSKQLKTWESILTCNVNPFKMKAWHDVMECLLRKLLALVNETNSNLILKDFVSLQENIISAHHFVLSPTLVDVFFTMVTVLVRKENQDSHYVFDASVSILEKLLRWRNALVMDRLPVFLQQFRILLRSLCNKSNSDLNLDALEINKLADCAHKLEKLTKHLVTCKKDMSRISMYLIADILDVYEHITLYSSVKMHLNNCVYNLISLCDSHAVSYLMRVLSSASTEMFKMLYEHYKKYYMFTGKV